MPIEALSTCGQFAQILLLVQLKIYFQFKILRTDFYMHLSEKELCTSTVDMHRTLHIKFYFFIHILLKNK